MRESRTYGSVRGVLSNGHPYRDSLAVLRPKAGIVYRPLDECRLAPAGRPGTTAPLRICLCLYFARPAASRIRSAISFECEIIDKWLAGSSMVVAFMRLARNFSSSGEIVWSSVETA